MGNSFLRGYYGYGVQDGTPKDKAKKKQAQKPASTAQAFMVADQSNPGFKEDLKRYVCVCVFMTVISSFIWCVFEPDNSHQAESQTEDGNCKRKEKKLFM